MEYKFRAWDKINKKMFKVTSFDLDDSQCYPQRVNDGEPLMFIRRTDCELMQYTGLFNKNCVEIYEGDILRVKSSWYRSKKDNPDDRFDCNIKGTTFWSVEYKIYNAEMGFYTFGIDRRWKRKLTTSRLHNAEAEIIGNIYENPELLSADKQ